MTIMRYISTHIKAASRKACGLCAICALSTAISSCEREPMLHLHDGADMDVKLPIVDLTLDVVWNYLFDYEIEYDWQHEWQYGWDDTDRQLFGSIGYTEPEALEIRRYYLNDNPNATHKAPYKDHIIGNRLSTKFDFGYWDLLVWNDIKTDDGVQSIRIDENESYDYVTAYTGQTMKATRYNAPKYTRAFYQPEHLFAGYEQALEIRQDLKGFIYDEELKSWVYHLKMQLQPVTYIYLVQIILHNNNNGGKKVIAIDGNADLSSMARSVTLNTGKTGAEPITVNYNMRMKTDITTHEGERVDIIGGKVITFGIPNLNPYKLNTRAYAESLSKVTEIDKDNHHYIDITMQFKNGKDSTLVFDVTDQVRRLYRGGVITINLDMDKVPIPQQSGGSAFDAVVKEWEQKEWEFDM